MNGEEDVLKLLNYETFNREKAGSLSMETINTICLPIISSRFTNLQLDQGIDQSRNIKFIPQRIFALSMLTDQIVTAYVSPGLSMIELPTQGMHYLYYAKTVGKEWRNVFKMLKNNADLADKSTLEKLHSFLHRQYMKLNEMHNKDIAKMFLKNLNKNRVSDHCFWKYSLVSIGGKAKPISNSVKKQILNSKNDKVEAKNSDEVTYVKGNEDSSLTSSPPPLNPCLSNFDEAEEDLNNSIYLNPFYGSNSSNYKSGLTLPLSSAKIGSYLLPSSLQVEAKIGKSFIGVMVEDEYVELTSIELTAVILSPAGNPPTLFLFLSTAGVLKFMEVITKVPRIPPSVFNDKAPASKRLIFALSKLESGTKEVIQKTVSGIMKVDFAEVLLTFGQLLSYGVVDYKRAFFDKSVQILAPTVRVDVSLPVRDKFRRNSKAIVEKFLGDLLNNERFGMSSDEWIVKTLLNDLLGTVVSEVNEKRNYWKKVVKVLQQTPQLSIDSNDGIESLENLALSLMNDESIQSKPKSNIPKIFVDGKKIPCFPFLSKDRFKEVNAYRLGLLAEVPKEVTDLLLEVQWRGLKYRRALDDQNPAPAKRLRYSDVFEDVCHNNNILSDPNAKKMEEGSSWK